MNPMPLVPPTEDAVVRVSLDGGLVRQIAVAGRPGPSGPVAYATAWAVFGDSVRRRLVGRSPAQAARALDHLVGVVGDHTERERLADGDHRARFVDAGRRARAALLDAGHPTDPEEWLNRAVGAYLSLRAYAPFAGAFLDGDPDAGAAESLAALRRHESRPGGLAAPELRALLWRLLDDRTLGFAMTGATAATLPGLSGPGRGRRSAAAIELVARHMREIAWAYPVAYVESGIATGRHLRDLVHATRPGGVRLPAPDRVPALVRTPPPAPPTWCEDAPAVRQPAAR
jgi:hypothetical protein